MALEIERKYLDVNFDNLRDLLKKINANFQGICFETNMLFDNEAQICEKEDRVIRLRINEKPQKRSAIFTMKWPQKGSMALESGVKIREELETEILQADTFRQMLAQLGYQPVLVYEKVRESWRMRYESSHGIEEVKVELDMLPFCNAVEIETTCDAINHVSHLLALDNFKISTTSYTTLYRQILESGTRSEPVNLIFDETRRKRLRGLVGLP